MHFLKQSQPTKKIRSEAAGLLYITLPLILFPLHPDLLEPQVPSPAQKRRREGKEWVWLSMDVRKAFDMVVREVGLAAAEGLGKKLAAVLPLNWRWAAPRETL